MKQGILSKDSLLTSYDVSALLQVDPSSVYKWVKAGLVRAFRTPGGHHRITAGDLVAFLIKQKIPIPRDLSKAGARRLMVVDDDPREFRLVERLFAPYPDLVDLRFVQQGIDALVQLGYFQPHAILLDVVMPGLDGVEVCRRLMAMEETRDVRVVVASAHLTAEIEADALAAGADRCLSKPVTLELVAGVLGLTEEISSRARVQASL